MHHIDKKLQGLNIELPNPSAPAANYISCAIGAGQAVVSGQLPVQDGALAYIGKVGREFSVDQGQEAARLCGIQILAQLRTALDGDWSRLDRLVRLGVFINATDDFTEHPKVANGVSDLMVAVLGDAGAHARAAVGVASLPFGVAVEVDASAILRD
jgi:enamine deaminase RidA (YjgF/YER057c/UK114 family)